MRELVGVCRYGESGERIWKCGPRLISTQGRTKRTDETYLSQVRCIEKSVVGSDLKQMRSCSLSGTGNCYFAARVGAVTLRWLHLEAGKVGVIEWRSDFS